MSAEDQSFIKTPLLDDLLKEDLSPYSIEDLNARLKGLQGEITRTQAMIETKKMRMAAADDLFNFKTS